jgi:hypothetical protein
MDMNPRHNPPSIPPADRAEFNNEYEDWCRELDRDELESINRLLNGEEPNGD